MKEKDQNLFKKLTTLFRSGPLVKRKIKKSKAKHSTSPSSLETFRRAHSDVYNSTLSAYGSYDRMARYSDFSEMEATPEISSALDIYSEECVSPDANGSILSIYCENRKMKEILDNLFYDIINVDFNLAMWVRNLCKYGDFFLFNDVSPEFGIVNVFPIPIAEIQREEGYDPEDPSAVRFRWVTQGNRVLENWQISHFRLLGNDAFLPYGSSVLEGARRIWRQLILIEDAMLVYRVIRAPERRVFYIDVGNIPPENVADYLQQAQTSLKRNSVIDKNSGQVDLRYNPLSVDEDYFIPVRGGDTGTKIDTLAGGNNTAAIEDVEYIQKKLFAALKIPKAYLGYDEDIGAKATLAQEDIRFSRTIQRIQKTIVSELTKIAIIHLYSHGYEDEDLLNFELKLSNPSSIAQQQKLELIKMKFDIASQAPESLVDREWIRKNILDLNNDEINRILLGRKADKLEDLKIEKVELPQTESAEGAEDDLTKDSMASDTPSAGTSSTDDSGGLGGGGGLAGLFSSDVKKGNVIIEDDYLEDKSINEEDVYEDEDEDEDEDLGLMFKKNHAGEKIVPKGSRQKYKNAKGHSALGNDASYKTIKAAGPSKKSISSVSNTTLSDISSISSIKDSYYTSSPVLADFIEKNISKTSLYPGLSKSLKQMDNKFKKHKSTILNEEINDDINGIFNINDEEEK